VGVGPGTMEGLVSERARLNALRDARVLVTGHTGFKGSWLSLWLQTLGAEVFGLALAPEDGAASLFVGAGVAGG